MDCDWPKLITAILLSALSASLAATGSQITAQGSGILFLPEVSPGITFPEPMLWDY